MNRQWIIVGSGQGYYASWERLTEALKVGPFSTTEKAQAYIDEHGQDSLAEVQQFQYDNFDTAQNNG